MFRILRAKFYNFKNGKNGKKNQWNNYIYTNLSIVFILLFVVCISIFSVNYIYTHNLNNPPIRSDGYGYYAYLPSIIIHHDILFQRIPQKLFGNIYQGTNKFLNKYTIGTAVLQMPFFLIAHVITEIVGLQPDGFSILYQYFNIASAFFYFVLGLFFLYKLLLLITNKLVANITILVTVFGTNLFHYATYDASFSHVYSFCFITLFLFFIVSTHKRETIFWHMFMGFLLGIITLIRVTNIIVVLFYLFYGIKNYSEFSKNFFTLQPYKYYLVAFLTFCLTFFPQCFYWYAITGRFIINSYIHEGFNWTSPQVINFLFSVQKGLFFWTPLWIVSMFGIFMFRKEKINLYLPLILYVPLQIYICSSWYEWYFGGSFGQRPFTDAASIFAIGFSLVLLKLLNMRKTFLFSIVLFGISFFVLINILEMIGYWNNIIPFENPNMQSLINLVHWYHL